MAPTIIQFPPAIETVIAGVLREVETAEIVKRAHVLHSRYMQHEKTANQRYINTYEDALAYLALRTPATYAQLYGALSLVQELIPTWKPQTLLDIGSGPGNGVWAAKTLFPSLVSAVAVDQDPNLLTLGEKIVRESAFPVSVTWKMGSILKEELPGKSAYDIVIISSVLNELTVVDGESLLDRAYNKCKGIMLVVEPGTPFGSAITDAVARRYAPTQTLLAPYVGNKIISHDNFWIHFPQRFKRPEFERRIRQHMRDSNLMASDWEEAKYSYVALGKVHAQEMPWGRCVGPVRKQKGFLEVPVLTKNELVDIKVMQRNKKEYNFAKNLRWGQVIQSSTDLLTQV